MDWAALAVLYVFGGVIVGFPLGMALGGDEELPIAIAAAVLWPLVAAGVVVVGLGKLIAMALPLRDPAGISKVSYRRHR